MAKKIKIDKEELIRDRLAYIGTLAGGLAHEIRNPLNSILLNGSMLLEQIEDLPGETRKTFGNRIERILQETRNLNDIVTEFLTFARPPRVEVTPTDLNDYLYDVIEFIQEECTRQKIHIHYHLEEKMYPLLLDRKQFGQVITNLIINARDAIGSDGHIHIYTRDVQNNELEIRIEDSGPGIPPEIRDKIFEVFYTTKEKGTGLGLGIARRIVNEHGGRLSLGTPVESECKTAFVIRLPRRIFLSYEEE